MGFTGRSAVLAILLIWVVPAIAACSNPSASADSAEAAEPVSGDPVVFADLNWQSALIQNRVA
jgi:ABC-type proline/glycine betaine transport system substrate-binding protein